MKIIQSFWSGNQKNINYSYGWDKPKYHWISWVLSCNQLVKYYEKVELYTDDFGYDLLINKLKLPYTKVHLVLNEINDYPKDLWAIAKIKTYSLQDEQFIHVDGDVFIWEKFPDFFKNSNLLAQNLENTTGYYRQMWNDIVSHIKFIPEELQPFHSGLTNLCCNMGIVGGKDVVFFKEFSKKSLEFVNKNIEFWSSINLFNFNIFFEQELFYEFATINSKKIDYLFDEIWGDNAYMGFGDFHQVPHNRTYLHLLGTFKRIDFVCKAMEIYCMKYYPDYYSNLMKLINLENNNNHEIDFLTKDTVKVLIIEFKQELKNNSFKSINFLLKRDLYIEGLNSIVEKSIKNSIDFIITLLPCFEREKTTRISGELIEIIKINQIDCIPTTYELDLIDVTLINELYKPIKYSDFIIKSLIHLEEENDESKMEFLKLINNRLIDYVNLKIIGTYES